MCVEEREEPEEIQVGKHDKITDPVQASAGLEEHDGVVGLEVLGLSSSFRVWARGSGCMRRVWVWGLRSRVG